MPFTQNRNIEYTEELGDLDSDGEYLNDYDGHPTIDNFASQTQPYTRATFEERRSHSPRHVHTFRPYQNLYSNEVTDQGTQVDETETHPLYRQIPGLRVPTYVQTSFATTPGETSTAAGLQQAQNNLDGIVQRLEDILNNDMAEAQG